MANVDLQSAAVTGRAITASTVLFGADQAEDDAAASFASDTLTELIVTILASLPSDALTTIGVEGTYAPLAAPALTGTATAPTPAVGNNTTRIATTAFTAAAITAGLASYATSSSVTTAVADATTAFNTALDAYAPLASPTLTGTPTAPTPASTTNTQQLATTAFVQTVISGITTTGGGFTLRYGATDPDDTLGADGDWYVQTATSAFWQRASGTWTSQFTIGGHRRHLDGDIRGRAARL